METHEAIALIKEGTGTAAPQTWADLGCGAGTFTFALAELLPPGSCIYAVDTMQQKLSSPRKDIEIIFQKADFEKDDLQLPLLNGILMANSLHYIKNQLNFVEKTNRFFKEERKIVIVEYDNMSANRWVPFPVDYSDLKALLLRAGYKNISKIGERNAVYGRKMYAALAC